MTPLTDATDRQANTLTDEKLYVCVLDTIQAMFVFFLIATNFNES